MHNTNNSKIGISDIVKNDYCIGCGACAVASDKITLKLNQYGMYQASLSGPIEENASIEALKYCPMSPEALTEDEIGEELFSANCKHDAQIGYYETAYKGYVTEVDFRKNGSSGGFGKWILVQLKVNDLVDEVIQVGEDPSGQHLYKFKVDRTVENIKSGSKSVYYPVEMSEILDYINKTNKRFAVTGVPCFIKAIRLLQKSNPIFKERIKFCVGLVCGHLKSAWYAHSISWQLGVKPDELSAIDFRLKLPNEKANEQGIRVAGKGGKTCHSKSKALLGSDYNLGFFQYPACDFCDDVIAETSDVSIGDAWLPECIEDESGTSIVVVRNRMIHTIMKEALGRQKISLTELSPERVVESQAGGYRQRKEGLSYRLWKKVNNEQWYPRKRSSPKNDHITKKRKAIYDRRTEISKQSFLHFSRAIQEKNLNRFTRPMEALIKSYYRLYTSPLQRYPKAIVRRTLTLLRRVIKK